MSSSDTDSQVEFNSKENSASKRQAMPDTPSATPQAALKIRKLYNKMSPNNNKSKIRDLEETIRKLQSQISILTKKNCSSTTTNNRFASLDSDDHSEMDVTVASTSKPSSIPPPFVDGPSTSKTTSQETTNSSPIPPPFVDGPSTSKTTSSKPILTNDVKLKVTRKSNTDVSQLDQSASSPSTSKQVPASISTRSKTPTLIKKPPPIVVTDMDFKLMTKLLSEKIGHNMFSFRRINEHTTHINTKSMLEFRATCELLPKTDAEYHSFTPKEDQLSNVVLRHLDASYNAEDIKEGINELALDITIHKIMKLPTISNKLWLIQLGPGSDSKQLLLQKYLLHQNVIFEPKMKNGIAQCKNCQLYGHSSRNCNHKYRCVKCTEKHGRGECPRTLNPELVEQTPPKCVNCNGDHPANFRNCPYFEKINQYKQTRQQQQGHNNSPRTFTNSAARTEGISYATAVGNINQTNKPAHVFDFFDEECKKHFNMEFTQLHTKMKEFYPVYLAMPDHKRPLALMSLALSL